MKTSKRKHASQFKSAPTVGIPTPPPTEEQIRQRAHEIYAARGGAERMALDDWLQAERELCAGKNPSTAV